jgi:hypothetical protein
MQWLVASGQLSWQAGPIKDTVRGYLNLNGLESSESDPRAIPS